jgi:hypothetical protein
MGVAPDQDPSITAARPSDQHDEVIEYYHGKGAKTAVVNQIEGVPLAFTRFYDYKKWIEPYDDDDLVLLSDTKDTFFQMRPFDSVKDMLSNDKGGVDLMMFREYAVHIHNQSYNRNWVQGCFGKEELEKIHHNKVLCSGTTMGTKKGVLRYLNVMLDWMERLRKTKSGCRAYGVDQGYHNYLFYSNKFGETVENGGSVKVWDQGDGPINTVGYVCEREGGKHSLTDRLIQVGS